jgi:hypothetical protein
MLTRLAGLKGAMGSTSDMRRPRSCLRTCPCGVSGELRRHDSDWREKPGGQYALALFFCRARCAREIHLVQGLSRLTPTATNPYTSRQIVRPLLLAHL